MTTPDGPPAGWYDDGVTPGVERWFDGTDWTEHTRPVAPTPPPPAAVPVAAGSTWTPGAAVVAGAGAGAAAAPAWQAPAAVPAAAAWGGAPAATGAWGAAPGVAGGAWGAAPGSASASVWPPAGALAPGGEYAGWGPRVVAYLLDALVVGVPYGLAYAFAMATAVPGVDRYGNPTPQPTSTGLTVLLVGLALAWGLGAWNRWVRVARTGRSLGKQALGLRVVLEETGASPGVWMCLVRDFAHVLDNVTLYIGYLWPLWDAKRQTFADKAVHTVVVRGAG